MEPLTNRIESSSVPSDDATNLPFHGYDGMSWIGHPHAVLCSKRCCVTVSWPFTFASTVVMNFKHR